MSSDLRIKRTRSNTRSLLSQSRSDPFPRPLLLLTLASWFFCPVWLARLPGKCLSGNELLRASDIDTVSPFDRAIKTVASLTREDDACRTYNRSLEEPLRKSKRTMLKANALFAFSQAANLWVVGAFSSLSSRDLSVY